MTSPPSNSRVVVCPSCKQKGKRVKPVTVAALLKEDCGERVLGMDPPSKEADACGCTPVNGDTGYRFCDSLGCDIVYFSESSTLVFTADELRAPVGVKLTSGDRPLCYCFGHSIASIKEEIRMKGRSDSLDEIRQKMKFPGCRCETENPAGSCCLGTVTKGIKIAQDELKVTHVKTNS